MSRIVAIIDCANRNGILTDLRVLLESSEILTWKAGRPQAKGNPDGRILKGNE